MARTRYGRYADLIEGAVVSYALQQYQTPGTLLDVGCEGGRWSKVFADQCWRIRAIDVDRSGLKLCKDRIPDATCIQVKPDQQSFPADNASVDLVLCIEVGPVIHTTWAAAEFARVLRRGGRVVGVCWNRTSWRGFLYHHVPRLRTVTSNPLVGYPIRYRHFQQTMRDRGFSFERETGYAWGPFRRTSNSRMVPLWHKLESYSRLQRLIGVSPMVAFVAVKKSAN